MTRNVSWAAVGALSAAVFACSSTPPAVSGSSTGGASSGTGGQAATGGAAAGQTDTDTSVASGFDSPACRSCAASACSAQSTACENAPGCTDLLGCLEACDPTDVSCPTGCTGDSTETLLAAQAYYTCILLGCLTECTATKIEGLGGAGGADPGGSTGATVSTGGTEAATGGATGESTGGAGGAGTGGAVAATGGSTTTGTQWLHIEGDWADPELAPNGELDISGVFYAYGDTCATLSWDPETRCATGTLCDPGATYANWGIAVGFDFHNTGETGTPPNAKLTWDPGLVGARGIEWQITGSAPGLQVWITNMDPSWAGVCTSDTCEIAGPPDGISAASLNGSLYFSSMSKDDWGGSGVYYTYDPAATLAIQFKLPAVIAGASSFSFCIDRLGIIL